MNRFSVLVRFEIRKILSQKKAILFLLALNVIPILASFIALLIFIKFKGLGFGNIEFSVLLQLVRGLFTGHMKFFLFIAPFFLALVVGDSFSGESGRGYLKTLLLTPVARWQIVCAKAISILLFLLLAVALGGFFLQLNLWVARAITDSPTLVMDIGEKDVSTSLVEFGTGMRLLFLSFVTNLTLVGFFILFSLFFDSAIIMTFVSLIVLMGIQTFTMMAPYLDKLDDRYGKIAEWLFTKPLSQLSDLNIITGLLEKKYDLGTQVVMEPLASSLAWAIFFFLLSFLVFERRQILN